MLIQSAGILAHLATLAGIDPVRSALAASPRLVTGAAAAAPANNGFALAAVVMALMILAVVYVLVSIGRAQAVGAGEGPAWAGAVVPILAVIGMGVAAYLTFVETQNVSPVCGPVGDCGSVQASPFSRLFGVLPVGLLGLAGYVAILAAWAVARFGTDPLAGLARVAAFGMAVFGVLFSIYLTYLELWVIKAVCIWCLSSAVLITALMVLTVSPALAALQAGDEEEQDAEPA